MSVLGPSQSAAAIIINCENYIDTLLLIPVKSAPPSVTLLLAAFGWLVLIRLKTYHIVEGHISRMC